MKPVPAIVEIRRQAGGVRQPAKDMIRQGLEIFPPSAQIKIFAAKLPANWSDPSHTAGHVAQFFAFVEFFGINPAGRASLWFVAGFPASGQRSAL